MLVDELVAHFTPLLDEKGFELCEVTFESQKGEKTLHFAIDKKEGIKKVSAKVLEKKKLSMAIAPEYAAKVDVAIGAPEDGKKPEALLTLIPKEYILGIGCRRNKEEQELKAYFPEFRRYEEQCRFQGCRHIHEPDCGVKAALAEHKISQLRYEDYLGLYNELKEKRRF